MSPQRRELLERKEFIMRKSIGALKWAALFLGGAGLCLGTSLALNPASNDGNEAQKAPLQLREDDGPLVRDIKDGTSFAPIVQKVLRAWLKFLLR